MKNCYELYKKLMLAEETFQNLQFDSKTSILKFEEQGKNKIMDNPEKTKQHFIFSFAHKRKFARIIVYINNVRQ